MAYEFKNLNEVPVQNLHTENTTVMAFEDGSPRQIPAGEFGRKGMVVDLRGYTFNTDGTPTTISDIVYDPIYEAIAVGQNVVFRIQDGDIDVFTIPMFSAVVLGGGFIVSLIGPNSDLALQFPNGSYHSTEAESK